MSFDYESYLTRPPEFVDHDALCMVCNLHYKVAGLSGTIIGQAIGEGDLKASALAEAVAKLRVEVLRREGEPVEHAEAPLIEPDPAVMALLFPGRA